MIVAGRTYNIDHIDNSYLEYAIDILEGRITSGKYIKLACHRYLSWFNRSDIEFKTSKVDRVVNFISNIKHYKGKAAGTLFKLEPWQKWVIYNIFGWYHKGTDKRVTNRVLIIIARKNGKSALAAAIALYMLLADGESAAEILNVANNSTQAGLLFDMEQNFMKSIDKHGKFTTTLRSTIRVPKTASYTRVLSSDSSGLDGSSPSTFILDESHEQKDDKLWSVLMSGQGYRTNPLAINISTNGFNLGGFLYNYEKMCIDILNGNIDDDKQFSAIYMLDEEDDWTDPDVWIKANPNMNITVEPDFLPTQIEMAKHNPSLEVGIRTKNLNQWCQSSNIWIQDTYLSDNMVNVDMSKLKNETVYMGVDLSVVSDLTAFSVMFPPNVNREYYPNKYIFKTFIYIPQEAVEDSYNSTLYKDWVRKGHAIMTSGNVVDYDYILKDQIEINNSFYLYRVAYDIYNSSQWAINATNAGLSLEPYSQGLGNFNRCTKEFEILLKKGDIIIDYNPIVQWAFQNTELKFDYNENCKPVKAMGDKNRKIDPVIAMLEALGVYLFNKNSDAGIVVI